MERSRSTAIFFFLLFLGSSFSDLQLSRASTDKSVIPFNVGFIEDLGIATGKRSRTSISLAIEDFYAVPQHEKFKTRIVLHTRDSKEDILEASSAAVDLIKNVQVQAIIGLRTSSQADFVIDIGIKTQVPILSFSATSLSLSSARTPYFVRTTHNDSARVGAIAALVGHYGWRRVVPIYEDTEYGTGIISPLIDALISINAVLPYRSKLPASPHDYLIEAELYKLKTMQTRVFIVHTMPVLGSRIFTKAAEIGMMAEGYVWIITDGLTNSLDSFDRKVIDAMQGVLGVEPYLPLSTELANFIARFKRRFRHENPGIERDDPTMFQFWAYDTVWALALAAEKAGATDPRFRKPQTGDNFTDLAELGVSQTGEGLLLAVLSTKFRGLAGEFKLEDGQLQSRDYQIVNVIGNGVRGVWFWNQTSGLFGSNSTNPSLVAPLKRIIWPGDPTYVPKGWEFPTGGKKLKIGVPVKAGFNQFVKVERDSSTNATTVSGYCIDVFEAVMQSMPYAVPYEYKPFGHHGTAYDDLVQQVSLEHFDAVVGDVTIVANRSNYVDFTQPFMESGVTLVVPFDTVGSINEWIFLRPLNTSLWLGSLTFFFFTGFVVWVIEHRINEELQGTRSQQLGLIFYFAFSTLVFAHKEKLKSNLSKFVVIIWVFVVLILTSSYTASLTSLLTVHQLKPKVRDISDLVKSGDSIGYQYGSFIEDQLNKTGFQGKRLSFNSPDEYAEALTKGSKNGGVAAIFDELPYLRLFLSEHCNNYSMVGQTNKTDGFGFVFPLGSSLVPDVNRAMLKVMEGDTMTRIEMKWFGDTSACQAQSDNLRRTTLQFWNFGGLFLITGVVSLLALFIFFVHFIYKEREELKAAVAPNNSLSSILVSWAKHYHQMDKNASDFKRKNPTDEDESSGRHDDEHALEGTAAVAALQQNPEGSQSPLSISNYSDMSFGVPEEGISSSEPGNPLNQTLTEMTEIREV